MSVYYPRELTVWKALINKTDMKFRFQMPKMWGLNYLDKYLVILASYSSILSMYATVQQRGVQFTNTIHSTKSFI